ncbi:RmlC-like cupin domain-containing protein [Xylogone sp. PMI_703]|nr:RmlC-like cupin domain-containing protein [Xylogone sp. PMI_703]
MQPIILPSNQPPERFYLGGPQISSFRKGEGSQEPRTPEDWIASTTTCRGHSSLGLSRLPGGALLIDAIKENPSVWLSPEHIATFGVDTKLLVKLIDAGQRLPVHAHPSVTFAHKHVGALHGKAEAWYILTPGEVYLGLREDVSIKEMLTLVDAQDVESLIGLMHCIPVEAHQTVYVPPGVLHAIGKGILLAEVQEPEDLSILLEWRDFKIDGRKEGHLGLGFETALLGVERCGRTTAEINSLVNKNILAPQSNEYFRLDHVTVQEKQEQLEAGFAILIVLEGAFDLITNRHTTHIDSGSTTVIPYAAGKFTLNGTGEVLIARPPKSTSD